MYRCTGSPLRQCDEGERRCWNAADATPQRGLLSLALPGGSGRQRETSQRSSGLGELYWLIRAAQNRSRKPRGRHLPVIVSADGHG